MSIHIKNHNFSKQQDAEYGVPCSLVLVFQLSVLSSATEFHEMFCNGISRKLLTISAF